jgi:hypothetical protein
VTDRALLFLLSVAAIIGAVAVMVWLIGTGQTGTFDGNFLFASVMVVTLVFGLYARSMVRNAMNINPHKPNPSPSSGPSDQPKVSASKIGSKTAP